MKSGEVKTVADGEFCGPGEWNISEDSYHADPCETPSLSASIAKVMIDESPLHAWSKHPHNPHFVANEDPKFDFGSAFHKLILLKGADIQWLDFPDFRTNAAKDARTQARVDGSIPILLKNREKAESMVAAARWQASRMDDLAYAMNGGMAERVLIWEEETRFGPIMCRAMLDWIPHSGPYLIDWKTTGVSAGPDGWGARTMWDLGADVQEAFYLRGARKVLGRNFESLLFAVVEYDAPFALASHGVMPEAAAEADRKVQWAINAWGACLHNKRWPGFSRHTHWNSPPGYRAARWQQREESGMVDLDALEEQIKRLESIKEIPRLTGGAEVTDENPFGLGG